MIKYKIRQRVFSTTPFLIAIGISKLDSKKELEGGKGCAVPVSGVED